MSEKLKKCPFCGGEAELCYSEVDIFCRKCNVMQETEMWNTRPIEDELTTHIAELEALVEQLIWVGNDLLIDNANPVTVVLFNGLVAKAKEKERKE